MKPTLIVFSFCILVSLITSCSSSSGGGPVVNTPDQMVAQGWQSYKQKNYQSALNSFTQAIAARSTYTDAYNGAGWSDAKLNHMPDAFDQFTLGYNSDSSNLGIRKQIEAGYAFIYNTQKGYQSSVYWAGKVLLGDSTWVFTRDVSVSAGDLFVLLAEDYFAMAKFDSSLMEVQKVDTTFSTNIQTDIGRVNLANEIEHLRAVE